MKRILSILLVAVLLVGCLPFVALAAGTKNVDISVSVGGTFSNFTGTVSSAYTIVGISGGGVVGNPASGKVTFGQSKNTKGLTFTVTVQVPETICGETVSVSFSSSEADKMVYDEEGNRTFESVKLSGSGSVTYNHSWGDWSETAGENCLTPGKKTRTCSICGDTQTEDLAVGPHKWGEWKTNKEATCEDPGTKTRECSVCLTTEPGTIDALGHDWDEGTVTTKPTCEKDGVRTFTCKRDENHTYTADEPATGHSFTNYVSNDDATCTKNGTETAECDHGCGKTDTRTDKGSAGHKWKNGKCTVCGKTKSTNLPVPDMGDTTPYGTYNAIVFIIAMIAVFSVYALVSKRKSVK